MKYSFKEFIDELSLGHEFELQMKTEKFGISWSKENKILLYFIPDGKPQIFSEINDFIENAEIEGKKFSEIWNSIIVNKQF